MRSKRHLTDKLPINKALNIFLNRIDYATRGYSKEE